MSGGGGDGPPVPGTKSPKQLSSRLMTMKFMQRAAASSPRPSASPNDAGPGPSPPSKRLKNNRSQPSTPPNGPSSGTRTPAYPASRESGKKSSKTADIDWRRAAQDAARAEENRRQAALARAGTQGEEETRWVLEPRKAVTEKGTENGGANGGLRIVRFGEVDRDDSADDGGGQQAEADDEQEASQSHGQTQTEPWRADGAVVGRMRFGGFKRKGEATPSAKNISDNDSNDEDGSGADSASDASHSSKEQKDPAMRTNPRGPGVGLGRGGGISSGGGGGTGGRTSKDAKTCYRCGQSGHIKSQCPMNLNRNRNVLGS